ncbi:putative glycine dehydrogenase (decarboxylating) subunit 2 [Variibacter gotjawalensis]|uniref:glycine dehydrogenase (aminomethyl-transferring) n=1 Tax=Variibacter gotjawalensis TaxID=1333996 RepID=A0A0S3PS34_9BRAD|nr:aminomethyl-transferring glycine dehydrogenase subunit GcvPB [Variibacter gotjawalensis]NIK49067.1 glycine dehydrogenase subunit 2 [Variibacter gotjawalensis]RZS50923.1 glycine dehydrogenase (decarboxylating) beta subunit [Variibacter gotjawalensis]BAT58757.1 putative glycine dehydrogenase (decarboxylating) subunit 2 [Variibacter gotjawalensis]
MLNRQGRPSASGDAGAVDHPTFTGNRALQVEEALIFEIGRHEVTGVDIDEPKDFKSKLGALERTGDIGLPGLSEPETMRHFVRLSQKNYGIDTGLFPLGSCTMKHNPRLNEKMARLPGIGDIHPLQPLSTVPGAIELIGELGRWLCELTGMPAVAMTPKAGAHGELCGMMAIKAAIEARGEKRSIVLVPESAHGTNPATAALIGYQVVSVPAREDGTVDPEEVKKRLSPDVAAIMLTNPNTCGLFERDVVAIADAVHAAGAFFYADGANFNAIVGKVRPGDLGVDAMHINLHKTFSTPHGGGGPGAGPVVLSKALAPFAPVPFVVVEDGNARLVENTSDAGDAQPLGRMCAFHGQMGMYIRAMSYMLSHGTDGMRQASEDAVLNANYIRASLTDLMSLPFGNRACMHEALFDDTWLDGTGVTTLDFAKAMIDEGYHPMTMYFPLVVHGAMLIEPTESESKASLDLFIAALRDLALSAKRGETDRFSGAPYHAPRRRLDETRAARSPILKWTPPKPVQEAAE